VLLIALLTLLAYGRGQAALQVYREGAVKSSILFNIIKFVEWPEEVFDGDSSPYRVCIFGESLLQKELLKWSENDYYGRPIDIGIVTDIQDLKETISDCHLLYLAPEQDDHVAETLALLDTKSVLSVSDYAGFPRQGGILALTEIDGKTRFSLNLDSAARSQLKISAKLSQLSHTLIRNGKEIGGGR
jgi:hypothetical protein